MTQTPTLARTLARFVHGLTLDQVPARVQARARLHFADSIGVALAASGFEYARRACTGLAALGRGEHTVIGMRARLGLRDAVLMNGMLVHGLEYDDTAIRGRVHPSAFVVPCALGAAAAARVNGRELLAGYIAGLESSIRIGMAARGGFSRAGFNATSVVGAFGAALTAGKLFGLDPDALTAAQGIAFSAATGTREFAADDAWTKRFEAGWPAATGITAAALAREGFLAPSAPYEGKFGVFRTHLPEPASADALAAVTDALGSRWELEASLIKLRPSCYFNHPAINATLAIVQSHGLRPEHVDRVRVLLPEAAVDTVCEPRARKLAARDPAAAQFSVYYAVAASIARGRFTVDEYDDDALEDHGIRDLAQRVTWALDREGSFPAHYSGAVEITTTDGRTLTARENVNHGSPERPLAPGTVEAKFLANAGRVLPAARAEALLARLLALEAVEDVAELAGSLGAT